MEYTDPPPQGVYRADEGQPSQTVQGPSVKFTVPVGMFNVTYDHGRLIYVKNPYAGQGAVGAGVQQEYGEWGEEAYPDEIGVSTPQRRSVQRQRRPIRESDIDEGIGGVTMVTF